jgi:type IV secretory pathway TrbD component
MERSEEIPRMVANSTMIAGAICFLVGLPLQDWFAIFGGLFVIVIGLLISMWSE